MFKEKEEDNVSAILSSIAKYQTVNILELMSLTPGLNDEEVRAAIAPMERSGFVKTLGEGEDQFVSLTNKGHEYLSSQLKMQAASADW